MTARRVLVAVVVVAIGAAAAGSPVAWAEPAHSRPQGPAKVAFAPDFPELVDREWDFPLGGFGGAGRGAALRHVPVIFVHGNTVDAADWYPVRDQFRDAGWSDQELWALSYNGLGGNSGTALRTANPERDAEHREMGWDGQVRVTNNEVNVPDLHDFIEAVRAYTGSSRFVLVTHSLGVTLARRTLKIHPELRDDLVAFVGIAGGNHGTSLCPPGSEGNVVSCDEIAAGTAWLAELNGPDGSDETYGPARWLTIYDGSGAADPAYAGPSYAESPALQGAENRAFPGTYHNDLRLDPAIVAVYLRFIADAEAEAAIAPVSEPDGSADAPVPAGPPAPGPDGASGGIDLGAAPPVHEAVVPPSPGADAPAAITDVTPVAVVPVSSGRRLGGTRSTGAVWVSAALLAAGLALVAAHETRRRKALAS